MPGPHDNRMKRLVDADPQGFLSLLLKDAVFTQKLATEFVGKDLYADALLEAVYPMKRAINVIALADLSCNV